MAPAGMVSYPITMRVAHGRKEVVEGPDFEEIYRVQLMEKQISREGRSHTTDYIKHIDSCLELLIEEIKVIYRSCCLLALATLLAITAAGAADIHDPALAMPWPAELAGPLKPAATHY